MDFFSLTPCKTFFKNIFKWTKLPGSESNLDEYDTKVNGVFFIELEASVYAGLSASSVKNNKTRTA